MVKPRVAAVIQARMGSSRFPGKVLRDLAGKPVLWHIVHRLRKSKTVNVIAVATSVNPADDPLAEFCLEQKLPCIRGSEDNVLDRYRQAARELEADVIIRVTGDAPLVDPEIMDKLVDQLVHERADYCTGDPGTPTIHEGFSPFTRKALEILAENAADDPAAVEHVTAYFKEHPGKFQTVYVPLPEAHNFTGARISVDTPADLEFLEEVYRRLGARAGEASIADLVALLRAAPELLEINSGVRQKSARERTRKAIIRCDGDADIGLGHIVRCLALAEELREVHSWGITFAVAKGRIGMGMIADAGFDIKVKPQADDEGQWLEDLMDSLRPDAIILDIRNDLGRESIAKLKRFGSLVVDIDDPGDGRLEADMAFYPPVPQVKEMDWNGFKGNLFTGWEWVVLRRQFADSPEHPELEPDDPPAILVTMGGSDPAGMTLKTAEAIDSVVPPFKALFVIGNAYRDAKALRGLLKKVKYPYEVKSQVQDMAVLMARADMAVTSFGVTAYELSAAGVPAVYLCLTRDHEAAAAFFERCGLGVNLGLHCEVSRSDISRQVEKLLNNPDLRRKMALIARSKIDGLGSVRIARKIAGAIDEKTGAI
jgi:spore coat polysaccharide biosynthesis protein SpsF